MAVNNNQNLSKSLPKICYVKDCHSVATKVINIPLNQKKSCLIDICQNCLEKFVKGRLISCDSLSHSHNKNEAASEEVSAPVSDAISACELSSSPSEEVNRRSDDSLH